MSASRINTELLARIRDHILEDERRFQMMTFAERVRGKQAPPCGTVACIAGWAVLLTDGMPKRITLDYYMDIPNRAAELLGLDEDEAFALFHCCNWPDDFQERYEAEDSKARVAADLIDRIIATGEVEVSEEV